ncbi:MAG: Uma2 family endonuclease [Microcoleus sp. PH2017_01_SCD_O_A]|uniref:Uma2 family endonuclease n=1 Tax=unclassified Microcoleus TaxID=2642155 RepID=UPI001DCC9A72|nr:MULTISPECIES: Uma2 family endonuclease [unclassified Microcoleus]MCC3431416.1 Uma2 family endonuclease [Microcoleus sp. PH2017_04_SCI_O_A]TAG65778.1 MAG: Uma2 family endonuclease [Oscillatoriales cyanobacterium]MCC3424631.1 Uma2 family endonuclease [Microcoleus sp. PH2017_01_SCD_O_A]MCC3454658.1 Uma2 family endonuclease [Microcoleus sp. PH2017_08_TRC_O_A]MCC3570989.1 Uma2 family endonuclease [Microcoleus sp. PH2017_34_RAT_O_A]
MLITEAPFTLRKWTVKEYQKLGEMGFFHPEERVELVSGNIIRMSAKGTAHTSALGRTDRLLQNLFGNLAWVRMQDPIALDDNSEPEPDIAVVRIDPFDYATHHPTPSEVYLIIEVADSSLAYDREVKANIYARSGIVDYWVLNVNDRQLHVFREPADDGYQSEVILEETASISPLQFPAFNIAIGEMLPPIISN